MPYPNKNPRMQTLLKAWIEKHPDRWYTTRYQDIAMESGCSEATVCRYYKLLVARCANILPSEVSQRMQEHRKINPLHRVLPDEEVAKIHQWFNEGVSVLDISFMTGRSPAEIVKYDPNKKPRKPKVVRNSKG